MKKHKKYKGLMFTELMVALFVLATILTILAISLDGFRRLNHYYLTQQRCIAASQAQLDSIAVTGKQISTDNLAELWPGLTVVVEKTDGKDQWQGLGLVKVTTKAKSFNKHVQIELSRYILPLEEN